MRQVQRVGRRGVGGFAFRSNSNDHSSHSGSVHINLSGDRQSVDPFHGHDVHKLSQSTRNSSKRKWHASLLSLLLRSGLVLLLAGLLFLGLLFSQLYLRKDLLYSAEEVERSFVYKSYNNLKPEQELGTQIDDSDVVGKHKFYARASIPSNVARLRYMHMGMLEFLPNGTLAAFFQSSESLFEGVVDQSIYWSISNDMGTTWGYPQALVKSNKKLPLWSPVVHRQGERMFVFFSRSSKYCEYFDKSKGVLRHSPGGDILMVASDDNGLTWTFPQKLLGYEEPIGEKDEKYSSSANTSDFDASEGEDNGIVFGVPKVIANKLVVLSNGAWLLPYWREPGKTCPVVRSATPPSQWVSGSAGVLSSENQGLTWRMNQGEGISHAKTWLIENSIAEIGTSSVLLQVFRTKTGQAYKDYSYDMGLTWTKPTRTYLPNPNSKMCILQLPNGNILAAYNHSPIKRTPLSLAISKDGGVFWTTVAHLETDANLQFAYPTMQMSQDLEDLVVIYSVMSKQSGVLTSIGIKTARIKLKKLLAY